jgi:hypothetical protein
MTFDAMSLRRAGIAWVLAGAGSMLTPVWADAPESVITHVDAAAVQDGDGSSARPYRSLKSALAARRGAFVLRPGEYPGPFVIRNPTELRGEGAVVLTAPAGKTVLTTHSELLLVGVHLRGGDLGLTGSGHWRVEHVQFQEQRHTALEHRTGHLVIRESQFQGTDASRRGLAASKDSTLRLESVEVRGPYIRGAELNGSSAEIVKSMFEGVETAIQAVDAKLSLRDVTIQGGTGPGIFCTRGSTELVDVRIAGHDYGVMCRDAGRLLLRGVFSSGASRAGIALVGGTVEASDLVVTAAGNFGGVQLVGTTATLREFWIHGSQAYGISARQGSLQAHHGTITDVRENAGDSDGIHLRSIRAELSSLHIGRVRGAAVLAAEASQVRIRDVFLERIGSAGIVTDTGASIEAESLVAQTLDGPLAIALGRSRVHVDGFTMKGGKTAVVSCADGSRASITRASGGVSASQCAE